MEVHTDPWKDQQEQKQRNLATFDSWRRVSNEMQIKLTEIATRDAQEGMKILLAINGGGVAGVLAFIGAVVGRQGVQGAVLQQLARSIYWFGFGVIAATAIAFLAYFSNSYYSDMHRDLAQHFQLLSENNPKAAEAQKDHEKAGDIGDRLRIAGMIAAAVSATTFIVGAIAAAHAIIKLLHVAAVP